MFRNAMFALAASFATLSVFASTLAVMAGSAGSVIA